MRISSFCFGAILALGTAGIALAAPPPNVTGLRATMQSNGSALLQWDAVPGDIAYYRVYYSYNSILENTGAYDDFEQTNGPETKYVLEGILPEEDRYVAVLAVNTKEEESEFFTEESHISAVEAQAETGATVKDVALVNENTGATLSDEEIAPLQLLEAVAVSPTEVKLTFSSLVQLRTKTGIDAFTIRNTGGETLKIHSFTATGAMTIVVFTEEQVPGAVYELRLTDALTEQTMLPLDEASRISFFVGFVGVAKNTGTGAAMVTTTQPSEEITDATAPEESSDTQEEPPLTDIRGLTLRADPAGNGLYNVTAEWDRPSVPKSATFLVVGQSFNDGMTVSSPHLVPANALNINIQGVPPGPFGLFIQMMNGVGEVSTGTFVSLSPPSESATPTLTASLNLLPTIEQKPTTLPSSGATVFLASIVIAGGVFGWRRMRRVAN